MGLEVLRGIFTDFYN